MFKQILMGVFSARRSVGSGSGTKVLSVLVS